MNNKPLRISTVQMIGRRERLKGNHGAKKVIRIDDRKLENKHFVRKSAVDLYHQLKAVKAPVNLVQSGANCV